MSRMKRKALWLLVALAGGCYHVEDASDHDLFVESRFSTTPIDGDWDVLEFEGEFDGGIVGRHSCLYGEGAATLLSLAQAAEKGVDRVTWGKENCVDGESSVSECIASVADPPREDAEWTDCTTLGEARTGERCIPNFACWRPASGDYCMEIVHCEAVGEGEAVLVRFFHCEASRGPRDC